MERGNKIDACFERFLFYCNTLCLIVLSLLIYLKHFEIKTSGHRGPL